MPVYISNYALVLEPMTTCDMCGNQDDVRDVDGEKLCRWCRQARKLRRLGPLHHGISERAWEAGDMAYDELRGT